jgi:putative hydrolase of the HAD superfamily
MRASRGLIIWDLDATLIDSTPLYKEAQERFATYMETWGADGQEITDIFAGWDLSQANAHGFALRHRFPASMETVAVNYWQAAGIEITPAMRREVRRIGFSVFRRKAPLFPDAEETLGILWGHDFDHILYTMGDPEVQNRRIDQAGIRRYFNDVIITPVKNTERLALVLRHVDHLLGRQDKNRVWVVGDSLRSDIVPALACGVKAIHVERENWDYDRISVTTRVPTVPSLTAVFQYLCPEAVDRAS